MLTLWDILDRRRPKRKPKPAAAAPGAPLAASLTVAAARPRNGSRANHRPHPLPGTPHSAPSTQRPSMADRYEALTRAMLRDHNVRVRKWRSGMTGVAWQIRYADGRIARLIEAPRPKGPMSAAVFLHEIGHHAIGFNVYRPRCLEEYHAWAWALAQMEANGLNITEGVRRRMHESLWYAVDKARRRGLREIPAELAAFTTRPLRRHGRG